MKKIIVTIAIGDRYKEISKITHPLMREYARKCGAEFLCWDNAEGHTSPHYQKLEIHDLFNDYDRVLYLDTDILIRADAPNLFDEIAPQVFAAFNEFHYTDRVDTMLAYHNDPRWIKEQRYFNTGVMLCSREHQIVFQKPLEEIQNFYEQTHLNFMLYATNVDTFELNHKFNRMSCVDKLTGESRLDSYFLHYAGYPEGMPGVPRLVDIMRQDLREWEKTYDYKRNIYFEVGGGLGDVVATEPVIRFMCENFYPNDNVIINTEMPDVFSHLKNVKVNKNGTKIDDIGYKEFNSMPKNIGPISHGVCHPTDFASLQLFRGQLSPKDKKIKLSSQGHGLTEYLEGRIKDSILVHPGKGWPSKTFAPSWWAAVVCEIQDNGIPVTIIGRDLNDEQGTVKFDTDAFDLTNQLTLKGLFRAIELSPVLISNDSSPVHIAGAFDNWIGLIQSCKPDYRILPHRNGSIYYKAEGLSKGFIDRSYDPTTLYDIMMDQATKEEIEAILPDHKDVAKWAIEKFNE